MLTTSCLNNFPGLQYWKWSLHRNRQGPGHRRAWQPRNYALVCGCVWAVLQSLSEMTIAFPVSGDYIDYAHCWVDPSLAFGAGFVEWLGT